MIISADSLRFDEGSMLVALSDGRTIGVPLVWFLRLLAASPDQREEVEISPMGLHWNALDEDISVGALLDGKGDQTRPGAHAA